MRTAALLLALALLAHPVSRAFAAATPVADAGTLSGKDADDDRTMEGRVDAHVHAMVTKWLGANPRRDLKLHLNSGGGSAKDGVMMYAAIDQQGRVTTEVGPGQHCFSACTAIWLAGHARTMADRSELGFHSSFCVGACDPRGMGLINQFFLDVLAHTEPALAVMVSNTGAMVTGNHLLALARRNNGHWIIRTYEPPKP